MDIAVDKLIYEKRMSRKDEGLDDKILELEEDLNHFLDKEDTDEVNWILFELDHLYKYKTEHQNDDENERDFDPEHLFDDINYIKLYKNYIKDKYDLL